MRLKIQTKPPEGMKSDKREPAKIVKAFDALDGDVFSVLGLPYGGPFKGRDSDGQAFAEDTDAWMKEGAEIPVTYYHGFGPDDPNEWQDPPAVIGVAKFVKRDGKGFWFDVKLDKDEPLGQRVLDADPRSVRASSGAIGHLVREAEGGIFAVWPVGELALFDTNEWRKPANDYAVFQAKCDVTEVEAKAEEPQSETVDVAAEPKKSMEQIGVDTKQLSLEKVVQTIYRAVEKALGFDINTNGKWVIEIFDDYVVTQEESKNFSYSYSFDGESVTLGEKVEVERDWKPVNGAKSLYKKAINDEGKNIMGDKDEQDKQETTPTVDLEAIASKLEGVIEAKFASLLDEKPINAPKTIKPENLGDPDPNKAFTHYLRTGERVKGLKSNVSAMGESTAAQGGYLVPDDFHSSIIEKRNEMSIVRKAGAMVLQTNRDVLNIPIEATSQTLFTRGSEISAVDEDEPNVDQVAVTVYPFTKLVKVSEDLLEDDATNLNAFLVSSFSRWWAMTENKYTLMGDGSGDPQGVFYGGTAGLTLDDTNAIGYAEVPELYYKLGQAYRDGAVWTLRDSTVAHLRGLSITNDWAFGAHVIDESKMMGKPYFCSDYIDAVAQTKKVMCFGNWQYYALVERKGLTIRRLNELYAGTRQVGILATVRFGGRVLQAEAFQYATTASG